MWKKLMMGILITAMLLIPIGCSEPVSRPTHPAPQAVPIVYKDYVFDKGVPKYVLRDTIISQDFQRMVHYVREAKYKKLIIEIHSPGGGSYEAARIVNMMEHLKRDGVIIETRVYGGALSAGFIMFVSGSKGYRFGHKSATFMSHGTVLCSPYAGCKDPAEYTEEEKEMVARSNTLLRKLYRQANVPELTIDILTGKDKYWTIEELIANHLADGVL
jgi:ATP-dependent protease ClpP protease subunit